MQVIVVKTTRKASLVRSLDGRQGWIQTRWIKADGTVSDATFIKAAGLPRLATQTKADQREGTQILHPLGLITRETEKAVAVEARWEKHAGEQSGSCMVWIPRSQIVAGQVKGWLLLAKAKEVRELFSLAADFAIMLCGCKF